MLALLNSLEIGYDDNGAGIPILFIHGFPHNRSLWAPQLQGLPLHARCVAADLRGFGESTPKPPYSMDQYADDLIGLLDVLHIDKAVVAGLSMGGYVAFATWRRHAARVRGLILANTKAGADSEEARAKRRSLMDVAREQGSGAIADSMITGMLGKSTRNRRPETTNTANSGTAISSGRSSNSTLPAWRHGSSDRSMPRRFWRPSGRKKWRKLSPIFCTNRSGCRPIPRSA